MSGDRTNNGDSLNMDSSQQIKPSPSFTALLIRLAKNCVLLVARFYVMCILIAYEWAAKLVKSALKPLEPIAVQIKKVPKKDVSAEGIFYQFLRLQFIVLLYLTPFLRQGLAYFTKPLLRLKDWAVDFVGDDKTRKLVDTD